MLFSEWKYLPHTLSEWAETQSWAEGEFRAEPKANLVSGPKLRAEPKANLGRACSR